MKPSSRRPATRSSALLSEAIRISRPIASGQPLLGQPRDRAEVEHPDPAGPPSAAGSIRKLPGCGSAWSIPVRRRAVEQEGHEHSAVVVALGLGPLAHHVRQRVGAVHPLGDQHLPADRDDRRHDDVRVVGERLRVRRLRLGLEPVVELVGGSRLQLLDQRLDVDAGEGRRDPAGDPGELAQVGHQRLAGAGVLHLDRHARAPSCQRPRWTWPIEAAAAGAPSR